MNQTQEWQIHSSDEQIITFNSKLIEFCDLLQDKEIDEVLPVAIDSEVLKVVKKFCEIHNYEKDTIRIKKPVQSNSLLDNLDRQSIQILELPGQEDLFDRVLAAAYYLSFDLLRQACLCILATQLFIGDDESDIQRLNYCYNRAKKQFGIGELTPEQELEAMQKNKKVFLELQKLHRNKLLMFEELLKEGHQ